MSATLIETLTAAAHVVCVEPPGAARVVLIVVPLEGASQEVHGALNLAPGPAAHVGWISHRGPDNQDRGSVLLRPGVALELELFMAGLSQIQAHACAEALGELLGWEERS